MGMVFLLLCLVTPYQVPPDSVKFLQKSVDGPAEFHGIGRNSGFDSHMRSYTCEIYV